MILATGTDLTDIRRIQRALTRYGERFTRRVFTDAERALAQQRRGAPHGEAATLAKRFAAKEATAKALGCGIGAGAGWQEIAIVRSPSGHPSLRLYGHAAHTLATLVAAHHLPDGWHPALHLSLTDEYPYAMAWVMISAAPLTK